MELYVVALFALLDKYFIFLFVFKNENIVFKGVRFYQKHKLTAEVFS